MLRFRALLSASLSAALLLDAARPAWAGLAQASPRAAAGTAAVPVRLPPVSAGVELPFGELPALGLTTVVAAEPGSLPTHSHSVLAEPTAALHWTPPAEPASQSRAETAPQIVVLGGASREALPGAVSVALTPAIAPADVRLARDEAAPSPAGMPLSRQAPEAGGALTAAARSLGDAVAADPTGLSGSNQLHTLYSSDRLSDGDAENAAIETGVSSHETGLLSSPEARPEALPPAAEPPSIELPRESAGRKFKVAFIVMTLLGLVETAVVHAAAWLGQPVTSAPLPGTEGPMTWGLAAWLLGLGVVMAPIGEEVLFRGGIMGTLAWFYSLGPRLLRRLKGWRPRADRAGPGWLARKGPVILAALASAYLFALVHLPASLLATGIYMGLALGLSYLYARHGLMASIFGHMINNFFAVGGLLLTLTLGIGQGWISLATAAVMSAVSLLFYFQLRAPGADKAGAPSGLSPRAAVIFALLLLGSLVYLSTDALFLVNNIFMAGLPALLLLIYASVKARAQRRIELGLPTSAPGPLEVGYTREGAGTGLRLGTLLSGALFGFLASSWLPFSMTQTNLPPPFSLVPTAAAFILFPALLLAGGIFYTVGVPSTSRPRLRAWAERLAWVYWGLGLGVGLAAALLWATMNLPGVNEFLNNLESMAKAYQDTLARR